MHNKEYILICNFPPKARINVVEAGTDAVV